MASLCCCCFVCYKKKFRIVKKAHKSRTLLCHKFRGTTKKHKSAADDSHEFPFFSHLRFFPFSSYLFSVLSAHCLTFFFDTLLLCAYIPADFFIVNSLRSFWGSFLFWPQAKNFLMKQKTRENFPTNLISKRFYASPKNEGKENFPTDIKEKFLILKKFFFFCKQQLRMRKLVKIIILSNWQLRHNFMGRLINLSL